LNIENCPFCGAVLDIDDEDTIYPSGIFWRDSEHGRIYYERSSMYHGRENECYQIKCGCGAEMHGDSKNETIENWNKRVKN
jgi:hypothetical protein